MIKRQQTLADLRPGDSALLTEVETRGAMRRRLLDLGLIPGAQVSCTLRSPAGDPSAYLIRGSVIALRAQDARTMRIAPCGTAPACQA